MTDGPKVRQPGRARCQLNYPRQEQVVQVDVLEKVKQARQEVEQHYAADVMGIRGPQWTCSTYLCDSKYTKAASDTHLANHLLPGSLCMSDMRTPKSPPKQRYDTQHYHAFTRGEVTNGWNLSTEPPSKRQLGTQQQQMDAAAATGTAKHKQALNRYQSPPQREEVFAASMRQQKEAAAKQAASLVKLYGPDGAAAMQQILAMKRPDWPYVCIRAKRDDVAAVQELPALGLI